MAACMKTTARKCKLMTLSLDGFWMQNVKIVLHAVTCIHILQWNTNVGTLEFDTMTR